MEGLGLRCSNKNYTNIDRRYQEKKNKGDKKIQCKACLTYETNPVWNSVQQKCLNPLQL